jgi:hypothetical protein
MRAFARARVGGTLDVAQPVACEAASALLAAIDLNVASAVPRSPAR